MVKRELFHDPLEEIDPVMEQAYSVNEFENEDDQDFENDVDMDGTYDEASDQEVVEDTSPFVENTIVDEPEDNEMATFMEEKETKGSTSVSEVEFPNLEEHATGKKAELDLFKNIPVNLSVELGRAKISLKEVFELSEGSIIELERLVGEPLDLVINGQLIAQGEVVAIDNNYGLRVTNIVAKPNT